MQPLISAEELRLRLATEPLVLVDARTGPEAQGRYRAGHLPGALFVSLEHDLARCGPNPAQGGRHPLPPVAAFASLLARLGIGPATAVVVYDDKDGANAAARFWWMLRSAGHTAVQVLDGGLPAATAIGLTSSAALERPAPSPPYLFGAWRLPLATIADVQQATHHGTSLVIDVREAARFRGETEPIDRIAGHIPSAINVPFTSNLAATGGYLAPAALSQKYQAVLGAWRPEEAIVHCGSGVTACHTLLAFAQAGLALPRLYVGSWSEWSRSANPIATGSA